MTLGQEVGKAYVNALACLGDGVTLASGLDNGRIQLWRHAHRLCEVAHEPALAMLGGPPEPITCLIALPTGDHGLAFASGAAGSVKLWTESGECAAGLPAPLGTAPVRALAVPARQLALAVTFRQARPFDERLPPGATGRGAAAEACRGDGGAGGAAHRLRAACAVCHGRGAGGAPGGAASPVAHPRPSPLPAAWARRGWRRQRAGELEPQAPAERGRRGPPTFGRAAASAAWTGTQTARFSSSAPTPMRKAAGVRRQLCAWNRCCDQVARSLPSH